MAVAIAYGGSRSFHRMMAMISRSVRVETRCVQRVFCFQRLVPMEVTGYGKTRKDKRSRATY